MFFAHLRVYRIIPQSTLIHRGKPDSAHELLKTVESAHILFSRDEYIEYLSAKMEGRKPNYPEQQQGNAFVNLKRSPLQIEWVRNNIRQRARRKGIEFCQEWENPDAFLAWYYTHDYNYSGRYLNKKRCYNLDVDSDLMTLGKYKAYSPQTSCLLPSGINTKIIRQHRIKTAKQCQKDIAHLDEILTYERPRGEIPAYILERIESLKVEYENKLQELEVQEQAERERKEAERQQAKEQRSLKRQRKKTQKKYN